MDANDTKLEFRARDQAKAMDTIGSSILFTRSVIGVIYFPVKRDLSTYFFVIPNFKIFSRARECNF